MKMGKFRDDGLAISWLTPRETENAAKKLSQIYGAYGLKLEIKANLSVVVYLDITLDLNTGLHSPFTKPNDVKNYVHKMSNHRPAVIKNIPKNINDSLQMRKSSMMQFSHTKRHWLLVMIINSTIIRQIP